MSEYLPPEVHDEEVNQPPAEPHHQRHWWPWILIGVGGFMLLDRLDVGLSGQWWGLALLIPLALALVRVVAEYRQSKTVPAGLVWWLFGASFPAVIGISMLLGVNPDRTLDWVAPVGLIVVGVLLLTRISRR